MSASNGRLLLVVHRPALAAALQAGLATLTGAAPERVPTPAAAVARAARGDVAVVAIDAAIRGLTADAVAALRAAGARVALVAAEGDAVDPALVAAGAAIIPAAALAGPGAMMALVGNPDAPGTAAGAATWPAPPAIAAPAAAGPPDGLLPVPATPGVVPADASYARRFAAGRAEMTGAAPPPTTGPAPPAPTPTEAAAAAILAGRMPPSASDTALTAGAAPGGRVLGVLDAGAGSAGTSVTHAVVDALAAAGRPALLLDFHGGGDRSVGRLGLARPGGGLAALAVAGPPGGPGWDHVVDAELRPIGPGLRVLPGLARPSEAALITEACVAALIAAARRRAAWVVVDLGRWSPAAWRRAARLACDDWLLVVKPDGPGVQAALAIVGELADEAPGRIGALALNRAGGPAAFPPAEVAARLGWPVAAVLPDDPAAAALAVARQVPLSRVPGPAGAAARQLADALRAAAEAPAPATPSTTGRRRGGARPARRPADWRARVGALARPFLAPFRRPAPPPVAPSPPQEVMHDPA